MCSMASTLNLSDGEARAVRAFCHPSKHMLLGRTPSNMLGKLFHEGLDGKLSETDSITRDSLVNLFTTVLLLGPNHHLYTHTFAPQKLKETFAFISTSGVPVLGKDGVMYDCGTKVGPRGEIELYRPGVKLDVPKDAFYVALFQCFGAFCLHLLFEASGEDHLVGPVLSRHIIHDTHGDELVDKTSNFVLERPLVMLTMLHEYQMQLKTLEASPFDEAAALISHSLEMLVEVHLKESGTPFRALYNSNDEVFSAFL